MSFGTRLRELREQAGLSQEQLAHTLGVSVFTVSRYERGEHKPRLDRLYDIARVLGVTVGELLGNEEQRPNGVLSDRVRQITRREKRKQSA